VHEYRVLTGPQLAALAFPSARAANHRLLQLYRWRVLDRFQPYLTVGSAPMHYVLDTAGAAVLAAEDGLDLAALGYRHDREIEIAHSLRLAHTIGVNGVFAALVAIAHHSGASAGPTDDDGARALTAWWSEARCTRHFGDLVRPDGYGRWREPDPGGRQRESEFFLEYDTGTETLARLAGKLADYERLAAASGITTPVLLWLPTPARERNARPVLAAALSALDRPDLVPLATTAATSALTEGGSGRPPDSPAAARWQPITPNTVDAGDAAAQPVRLARLADAFPQLATLPRPANPATQGTPGAGPGRAGLTAPSPMPPLPRAEAAGWTGSRAA
jgi:hypothetical protein